MILLQVLSLQKVLYIVSASLFRLLSCRLLTTFGLWQFHQSLRLVIYAVLNSCSSSHVIVALFPLWLFIGYGVVIVILENFLVAKLVQSARFCAANYVLTPTVRGLDICDHLLLRAIVDIWIDDCIDSLKVILLIQYWLRRCVHIVEPFIILLMLKAVRIVVIAHRWEQLSGGVAVASIVGGCSWHVHLGFEFRVHHHLGLRVNVVLVVGWELAICIGVCLILTDKAMVKKVEIIKEVTKIVR